MARKISVIYQNLKEVSPTSEAENINNDNKCQKIDKSCKFCQKMLKFKMLKS